MVLAAEAGGLRLYYIHHRQIGALDGFPAHLERCAMLGFDAVLLSPPFAPARTGDAFCPSDHRIADSSFEAEDDVSAVLARLAEMCASHSLKLLIDWPARRFALEHPFVERNPECFSVSRAAGAGPIDPRKPSPPAGAAQARVHDEVCVEQLVAYWSDHLRPLREAGVAGFRCLSPAAVSAPLWRRLCEAARRDGVFLLIADTHGRTREDIAALAGVGFDYLTSSLAWWDYRASWLAEEYEALRAIAPVIATPEAPFGTRLAERVRDPRVRAPAYRRALAAAAASGSGILVPAGFEFAAQKPMDAIGARPGELDEAAADAPAEVAEALKQTNALMTRAPFNASGPLRVLTDASAETTALLRSSEDPRAAAGAALILLNPALDEETRADINALRPAMGAPFGRFHSIDGERPLAETTRLAPAGAIIALAEPAEPICIARGGKRAALAATKADRVILQNLSPSTDGGAYPAKRIVGDTVIVEAEAFADGHESLSVELRWRACDEDAWRRTRMRAQGNDVWRGELTLERMGRHEFTVEAWLDKWAHFRSDLAKKFDAQVEYELDLQEGRILLDRAVERSEGDLREALEESLARYDKAKGDQRVEVLLSTGLAEAMSAADDRPFCVRSAPQPIDAERTAAGFASWYELFPRSQTDDPARHGTFLDVIPQLPRIRAMGFDVLYFTPIHPIGRANRKGPNNTLTPGPDDPGSPYAIGSEDGGHDALHPELGTLKDFQKLREAALDHGMELALDFAIQCSPDHPWLKEHPGWFDWRPDGSLKYAENPPKKYQDIVNVDFYKEESTPDLWLALRDVVLFWVDQGVKTFRVDNPHTKPMPFWRWMIEDVRAKHPDVIFLSEAFTRPKVMYHLAKAGFSQSYTYFTWRNTKQELTDYLIELTTTAPKDFFRPHFFVNTPDINPLYLQSSGRPGFLVRACLAATLSGLWGMYSGFELLESAPLPGKEEYKDSEKYEIRVRDWDQPGNIASDIAMLNRIRKSNPALHTHLGVQFYNAWNDYILYYGKMQPSRREMILVAVNLDPHTAQEADFELPLWEFELPDHEALAVDDLCVEKSWIWRGKTQHMRLDPSERPFAIWRVKPAGPET